MARSATVFEILIASPSDVSDERGAIRDAINDWNILNSRQQECVLLPVMWETHTVPAFGERPQAIVNQQIVDTCDALIGTFWTRLGSPTGTAPSGTVEEIERIHSSGRPVMLYFSNRPTNPSGVDLKQLEALRVFQSDCRTRGLHDEYMAPQELSRKLALGLSRLVEKLKASQGASAPTAADSSDSVSSRQKQVSGLKQMQVKWNHNTRLGGRGHDDCQDLMSRYFDWYVGNHETLASISPAWEVLGDLANQLTRYVFTMGNSKSFYELGDGVLAVSLSLMENGIIVPELDTLSKSILQFILNSKSRNEREEIPSIALAVGASEIEVEGSANELERLGLLNSQLYIRGRKDYALSGKGTVRALVEAKAV